MNVRKFVVRASHLDDLVGLGTVTRQAADFLEAAVVAGVNILVAGGTQAGKTTLLNCLLAAVPARERVVTCEEVFELQPPLPDVVAMQTRQANLEGSGEIRLRRLVKEALRMRPSRIIVGEVRQEESLDLLIALNSGLASMHIGRRLRPLAVRSSMALRWWLTPGHSTDPARRRRQRSHRCGPQRASRRPARRTGRDRVVPGATHLFEEPGALEAVVELATGSLNRWLAP